MSPTDSDTDGVDLSLRSVMLALLVLLTVRLGTGWAGGLVDGNYLLGTVGVIVALVPIVWLLVVIRAAYF